MTTLQEAVNEVRRWQRHYLLRQFGENGHVLPENIKLSRAIDILIEAADPGGAVADAR